MPFKTRRQKLAAAQRRFTVSLGTLVNYVPLDENITKDVVDSPKSSTKDKHIEESYTFVFKDLVKIGILVSSIIILQLCLFFFRG